MTERPEAAPVVDYDPASMPTSSLGSVRAVWYKRPWFLVTAVIVLVVAVSVITDLPHPITKAEDAHDQNAVMKQANTDIKVCAYAVSEAFTIYQRAQAGTLSAANRTMALDKLLPSDQVACSFAGSPLTDLTGNIQVNDTTAGKHIDALLKIVVTWMANDANASIVDIRYLLAHPGDAVHVARLAHEERFLATDRAAALAHLSQAEAILGLPLVAPVLPALPQTAGA